MSVSKLPGIFDVGDRMKRDHGPITGPPERAISGYCSCAGIRADNNRPYINQPFNCQNLWVTIIQRTSCKCVVLLLLLSLTFKKIKFTNLCHILKCVFPQIYSYKLNWECWLNKALKSN